MKNRLGTVALFGAMGLVVIGFYYKIPIIIALTVASMAAYFVFVGLQMLVTRKAKIPMSDDLDPSYEEHTGSAALFYGVFILIISVPALVFALAYLIIGYVRTNALFDRLMHAPTAPVVVAIAVGMGFILYGLTRILPGNDAAGGWLSRWSRAMMLFVVGGGIIVLAFFRSLR
jgi:hypothetical protein